MPKLTFSTIRPGDRVLVDGSGPHVFLGFSDCDETHGSGGVAFAGWRDMAEFCDYKSFRDMDRVNGTMAAARGYGHGHYALFRDGDDGTIWTCYRYEGRWVYGSSCSPARLAPAEEK